MLAYFKKMKVPVFLSPAETIFFERCIKELFREFEEKKTGYRTIIKAHLTELIIRLVRYIDKELSLKMSDIENDERIERSLKLIEREYAEKITLKELADSVRLVPSYFSVFFRKETGYSVSEYINEFRIYKACSLLKGTKKQVIEIAYETGYNSISLFNRIFKRIIGFSPRRYRQVQKSKNSASLYQ